jgi:hypothetical protein
MQFKDAKAFDQQMNLIFHAVLAGPLLFYGVSYLRTLEGTNSPHLEEFSISIKTLISFLCGSFVFLAFYLYRKEIRQARDQPLLDDKLKRLYTGSLIHYALLEFASIIAVLAFFLTFDHLFTAIYVAILFLMSINRPTPRKYVQDLLLRGEERDIIMYKKERG